jgi:ABC-2 type transport system ATP-binding protein
MAEAAAMAKDAADAAPGGAAETEGSDGASVEARGLGRSFGAARALSGLSFTLRAGSRTALLGPNGAGKSTLMKIVAGVLPPDEGSVLAGGVKPTDARRIPGFLGWLPERAPLNPELTVREHLELGGKLKGLGKEDARMETDRLSEALNLGPKLGRLAGRLSLGTRRQAALALALMGNPRLLMLDEPSSSLDPEEVRRLNGLVSELPVSTTLIVSSHVLDEARLLTDGALILKAGGLAACGGWEELGAGLGARKGPLEPGYAEEVFFAALGGGGRKEA